MGLLSYFRQHIWAEVPRPGEVTGRQRAWAALLWGGGLIALAGVLAWNQARHQQAVELGLYRLAVAGAALGAAMLIPVLGGWLYSWILRFFSIVGFVLSHLVLTLAFYLIVTPMGLVLRLLGKDPLQLRRGRTPAWSPHRGPAERKRYYRLF